MPFKSKSELITHLDENSSRLKFLCFWGHREVGERPNKACLSQWYPAAFAIDSQTYPTAEHFLMAEKARLFGDYQTLVDILASNHPGEAKRLGRQVRDFEQSLWDSHKMDIAIKANLAKFGQHADLGAFLRGTGTRILVEASPVDAIWGIGLKADDRRAEHPAAWPGENLLGFALMQVRERLQGET